MRATLGSRLRAPTEMSLRLGTTSAGTSASGLKRKIDTTVLQSEETLHLSNVFLMNSCSCLLHRAELIGPWARWFETGRPKAESICALAHYVLARKAGDRFRNCDTLSAQCN